MFDIELLPAGHGDCIWIEYGDPATPSRILIDCGPQKTYQVLRERVNALPAGERDFDLFVLTHIDADHIGGAIPFFKDEDLEIHFEDVWFNGWKHLPSDRLGGKQAEIFSTLVRDRKLNWNVSFDSGPIMVDKGPLPVLTLRGGMKLTILSPTPAKLKKLRAAWAKELKKHGLTPGSKRQFRQFLAGTRSRSTDVDALADSKFKADTGAPNGASIAFLAEFGGKSALLIGDAHSPLIASSVEKLLAERGGDKLAVDVLKVSHHASKHNLHSDLVKLLDCDRYMVSTNGSYFHHPDGEAIARVIKYGGDMPSILFNYKSSDNEVWGREDLEEKYGYRAVYPEEDEEGIKLSL